MKKVLDLNEVGFLLVVLVGGIVLAPILLVGILTYSLVAIAVWALGGVLKILLPVYRNLLERVKRGS
jgi:hypothetical protein